MQQTELLTVVELAARWNLSVDFIYRRLNPLHPQYIPHLRLPNGHIRFDDRLLGGYLHIPQTRGNVATVGSTVRGGCYMPTRQRDRQGTLRIRGRRRKYWEVAWSEGEKRRSKKLGWCNEMTKSQAGKGKRDFMVKINQQREEVGESLTLAEFWKSHYWDEAKNGALDELKTKRPSTQRDMKNAMRQILLPRFGDRRMDSIKTGEVQSYLISLIGSSKDGKVCRKTVLKLKAYLSSVFSAAIRLDCGVIRNPVRAVRLSADEPAKTKFVLDDLQTQQIAESLEDPRHKMMWNMNLWMGNRIGETRALRWKSIDWETGRVTVTESLFEGKSNKPKTKAGERGVVLNEAQLAELREYEQKHYPDAKPDGWVFPGKRNSPIDTGWFMTEVIKPIAAKLGFPEIHWHALRHWNNSAMLNSGIDPAVRMKRVGHVSVRTNLIYSHADDTLQRAASEAIWQRLQLAKQRLQQQKAEPQTPPSASVPLLSEAQTEARFERIPLSA